MLYDTFKCVVLSPNKYNLYIGEIYCFGNQIICQTWVNSRTTPQILFIWPNRSRKKAKTERSCELNCKKQTTIF